MEFRDANDSNAIANDDSENVNFVVPVVPLGMSDD